MMISVVKSARTLLLLITMTAAIYRVMKNKTDPVKKMIFFFDKK